MYQKTKQCFWHRSASRTHWFFLFLLCLIPYAKYVPLPCSCSLACIHWWKCRESYNLKQNIAALLEGTILQKRIQFGQMVAIWWHFWMGMMKGNTGVTDSKKKKSRFYCHVSTELIQEISQASFKLKIPTQPTPPKLICFIITC